MYNTHFAIITASSFEDVISNIDVETSNWEKEDQWIEVEGIINIKTGEYNKVERDNEYTSIDKVKQCIIGETTINKAMISEKDIIDTFYEVSYSKSVRAADIFQQIADKQLYLKSLEGKSIEEADIATLEYRPYEFNKVGITNFLYADDTNDTDNIYCAVLSVHS